MPRQKISEYRAKQMISTALELPYEGWSIQEDTLAADIAAITDSHRRFVVKVDQAVKGRFKKGLVALDIPKKQITDTVQELIEKGYSSFIVEPYVKHETGEERYLSIVSDANGLLLNVSDHGGVDIESQANTIQSFRINDTTDWKKVTKLALLDEQQIKAIIQKCWENHCTFLEINPYIIEGEKLALLDLAIEVDDVAALLVSDWTLDDVRMPPRPLHDAEQTIARLSETSPASFMLQVMNPDGSVFLLLSGGGASLVVADEVYRAGYGKELANYGEYSGNPTLEETYIYTEAIFKLMLASKSKRKVLFIGGAVANFTNIEKTFGGIIKAIDEHAGELTKQGVKVVVRRGGPHQEKGLKSMREVLAKYDLLGAVYDQKTSIGMAVERALEEIQ